MTAYCKNKIAGSKGDNNGKWFGMCEVLHERIRCQSLVRRNCWFQKQPSCPEVDGKDGMRRDLRGGPHLQLPTCHCCRELHGDTKTLLVERHGPFMSEASGRTEQSVYKKKGEKWNIYSQVMSKWQNVCVRVCAARRSNVGNATGNRRGGRWSGVKRECEWDVGNNTHTHTHERQRERCGQKKEPPLLEDTHHVKVERGREAAAPLGGGGRRG